MKLAIYSLILGSVYVDAFNDDGQHSDALMRSLMRHRDLQDTTSFPVDISSYSLRFEKCQGVKTRHNEKEKEDETKLIVERFATFRLCPRHDCNTCNEQYGEYVLHLGDYLYIMSRYIHETKGALCETCRHCKVAKEQATAASKLQDFGSSCNECDNECHMLDNLEANGYIDATNYLQCTLLHKGPDGKNYYAAPVCSHNGEKVKIGVFVDDYCSVQDTTKDIHEFLKLNDGTQMRLAYNYMKLTYQETCFSCLEDQVEGRHDYRADEKDTDHVKHFCETIYDKSAKCEAMHAFAFANVAANGHGSAIAQERETCEFIKQINAEKHTSDNGEEQFIEDNQTEIEGAEEKEMSDAHLLVIVFVGTFVALLVLVFRMFCNANASHRSVAKELSEYKDEVELMQAPTEDLEGTEEESSSSTLEESGLLKQCEE